MTVLIRFFEQASVPALIRPTIQAAHASQLPLRTTSYTTPSSFLWAIKLSFAKHGCSTWASISFLTLPTCKQACLERKTGMNSKAGRVTLRLSRQESELIRIAAEKHFIHDQFGFT